ncbi:SDR family NAD(P)-dependent oxidoreductase [Chryseobacterium hispalense]|uniref:SDR family NAD(P)-dependent oxidoreductase n=1 Tax=Chryseobacterium hispalense TaxID=1453492 RepID=UPI000493A3B6|nr:SDR family oxidoreductase [Chryseobacterium hispalense]
MNPIYDFKEKVVLITGASSGLGFATAEAFAASGASVVLSASNKENLDSATKELANKGYTVKAIECDVTDDKQVANLVEQIVDSFGKLDIAFNNAGIDGPHKSFTETTLDDYDQVNAVNLRGVWSSMKHELVQMEKQGSGIIVNCSSIGGLIGLPGRSAYHATKHGVLGLTKSAGVEYAKKGIRINAVCPGVFDTPMFRKMSDANPEALKEISDMQPIGRIGDADELAAAVLWLCSPAASFVIGTGLSVDGGFTAQ